MAAELFIGSETTSSPCLSPVALGPLEAKVKVGSNRRLPGLPGKRPYATEFDEVDVVIEWRLTGRLDPDGDPHSDAEDGVDLNCDHYRTLFMEGVDAQGQKAATLVTGAGTKTADIQVVSFDPIETGPTTKTILTRIRIADGGWTESGS